MKSNIVVQENGHFFSNTAVMDYNVSLEPGEMLVTTNVPCHDGNGGRGYNTLSVNITKEDTDDEVFYLVCKKLKETHVFGELRFARPPYIRRYL